jgi:hypothetical protein
MYSVAVTERMIAMASRAQNAGKKPEERWDLEYSSPDYISSLVSHFESLIDDETGELKRPLEAEEVRAIQNERKVSALDWRYWSRNYARIVDWEKKIVPFVPNVAQSIVVDAWAEHEDRGIAIMLQQLKARQLGITTVNQMAVTHRFQFWEFTNAIVASADPKKTVEMGQMIKFCLDAQPWWMLPSSPTDKQEKGMTVEYAAINSRISIQSGNQFHGVARGATPNVGQLSEVSSWSNAEDDIDAAFIRAVHETPDVFVSLESTALGRDNWWADSWEIVKEDWPRGRSRLRGVFLPWFVGTDIYPTPTDLRARPVPGDWIPSDRTIAHAERARAYVLANPMLFKYLAKGNRNWRMPREQMWYYEIERDTAVRKKTLNKFLAEMPADDHEAFQNTGLSVIDQDVVMVYRDNVKPPVGVYAIVGDGIHQSLIPPRHLWWTGPDAPPTIPIHVASLVRAVERYEFIPLKFEGYPGYDPNFKLFIWEWPEDGETYGVGVDTSDGIGQDWSVLEGLRLGTAFRPHGQVFEYASPYIKADQLWPLSMAVSTFFSVWNIKAGRRTQCRVCVECRGNGEIVQNEMKKRGWSNFHPWKKYDNKKRTPNANVHKEGVFTNVWFRSMMMDKFLTVIDEEAIDIGSPWLVNELASLERDPDEASARAAYNTHDDRVIGLCFPLFSLTVDTKPTKTFRRSTPQYLPEGLSEHDQPPAQGYAIWRPGAQASHLGHRVAQPVIRSLQGQTTIERYRNPSMPEGYR